MQRTPETTIKRRIPYLPDEHTIKTTEGVKHACYSVSVCLQTCVWRSEEEVHACSIVHD